MRRMIRSTTSGFSTMGITRDLSVRTDAKREPGANLVPNAEEVVAMIPQITQIEPDSLEQYWCGKCGTELPNPELTVKTANQCGGSVPPVESPSGMIWPSRCNGLSRTVKNVAA